MGLHIELIFFRTEHYDHHLHVNASQALQSGIHQSESLRSNQEVHSAGQPQLAVRLQPLQ